MTMRYINLLFTYLLTYLHTCGGKVVSHAQTADMLMLTCRWRPAH